MARFAAIMTGVGVSRIAGAKDVEFVELTDGRQIKTDTVVVAIGVIPATDFLEGSGLTIDNGIVCDASLRAAPDVFAIGDVRSGSIKRVASAVGEGSVAISKVWEHVNQKTT